MAIGREQFIVDDKGNRTAVVLSWRRYRKLMEDLHDLAVVAERRREKPLSLSAARLRLKEDGIL
jgi:hypothetical protein